jgi:hypothetical protein
MLAVLESRVNEPFPFSRTASTRYGRIIFASHCHNSQTRELFGLPWNAPDIDVDTSRLPRIVIIQANKFSSISGECYSLRRRVIRDSVAESLPLDVYGADWKNSFTQNLICAGKSDFIRLIQSLDSRSFQRASYGRYRHLNTRRFRDAGITDDKFGLLSRYQFSLVLENDAEYVSEKVKDSLACGCITFYLGPDVELLSDLPGLVRLPRDPSKILATISTCLIQNEHHLPNPKRIREAALDRFPHPSSEVWNSLGETWLRIYSK